MVLALETFYAMRKFGAEALLGPTVALSMIRELGPVISALMITARAGSALTAEIGIMRITEQIDALELMALNPYRYLIVPNILAGLISFPLLAALFDVVGIYGGYLVGVKLLGLSPGTYFGEMRNFCRFTGDSSWNVQIPHLWPIGDVGLLLLRLLYRLWSRRS